MGSPDDLTCGDCTYRDPAGTGRRWCDYYKVDLEADGPFQAARCEACKTKGRPTVSRSALGPSLLRAFELVARSFPGSSCSDGSCPSCRPKKPEGGT